jgi:putative transposase
LAGRNRDEEDIAIFGHPEGVHFEAGRGRASGGGDLPAGWHCPTYFKYNGLTPPEMRRLKQLEGENAKLKKLVADLSLDREMPQDVIRQKL